LCRAGTRPRLAHDSLADVVTAKTQYSLSNAQSYFAEHLAVGDYYQEGQKVAGEWFGVGARSLGLKGIIREKDFLALCENQNRQSGDTLTQRTNTVREEDGKTTANRRIFYDFTFSPPKSVSVMALLADDKRIIEAHNRAIQIALTEFEAFAATRVRKNQADDTRITKNVVAGLFTHDTSRALDPHLHTHCIVFNATFDETEQKWKALQNYEMLRARKYVEAVYYHELIRDLRKCGYQIRSEPRGDFQIEGVDDSICRRFSKRHEQINEALDTLLKEKPELARANLKDLRERLATAERSRKIQNQNTAELQQLWEAQLTPDELKSLRQLTKGKVTRAVAVNPVAIAEEAVTWAEEHLFDRRSAVLEHTIWQEAIEHARNQDVSVADLKQVTAKRDYIRKLQDAQLITRRDVLAREWEIVKTARAGVCVHGQLLSQLPPLGETLSEEQRNALTRLLTTKDFITLFRGGAGTGKSFVLKQLADELQANGRAVTVLAPQRQQVIDLQKSGLPAPTTVADFLNRAEMPSHGVVIVDETGQIGARQMLELIRIVNAKKGRIIFSGDTRQHGPVEASDALLALERYAQLQPAELETIRRQDPELGRTLSEKQQIRQYRQAVKEAAAGRLAESFDQLVGTGAIKVCRLEEQQEKLAEEYVTLAETGQSLVVVAQTWAEVNRVNERVREALKKKCLVAAEERQVEILEKLDLTTAQKRDERFAAKDQPIVFNQPVRGFKPGTRGKIFSVLPRGVLVEVNNKLLLMPHRQLDKINICRSLTIPLAQGDRLQIKANRRMAAGKNVTNGELVTVKAVRADGRIDLADGRTLDASFREFLPGYAVTSYGSQGKTVDYVLFSDSAVRTATDRRQWYVTISRGRRGIRLFTPDKEQLRENVIRSGDQPLALDLVSERARELFSRRMGYHRWSRLLSHLSPRLRFILPHIWHMENYRRMTQTQTQTHGQQTT
jgi:conjugative relaxase-like TrwC/TraI family protein